MQVSQVDVNGTNGHNNKTASVVAEARAEQLQSLLDNGVPKLCSFIANADCARRDHQSNHGTETHGLAALLENGFQSLESLETQLRKHGFLNFDQGPVTDDLASVLDNVLKHSVNTSAPGFLDKLYAAPLPPGIFAELVLAVLNTNVHVYQVSPVLTLIEKHLAKMLADRFGLCGPHRGGISVQGGSASNMTALVIARNTKFPATKISGNSIVPGPLVIFTSAHGHYSIEKAAQAIGLGSKNVITVPVDRTGAMNPVELEALVQQSKQRGEVPFFVNATAGTTVLGSFDPFEAIHRVAQQHNLWMHIDAAWGGSFIFSNRTDLSQQLFGAGLVDSIATNPHKMLGIPVTCSFLLGNDLRQFQEANTLKAGYLFHEDEQSDLSMSDADTWGESQDLADLTLQCGRRGDSLKFFMALKYYGLDWYAAAIDNAYELACYAYGLVENHVDLSPVISGSTPSCLQVCFSFTPGGHHVHSSPLVTKLQGHHDNGHSKNIAEDSIEEVGKQNSRTTSTIAKRLISRGFMIDYAPPLEGQAELGAFFRVVINISTVRGTVDILLRELVAIGHEVVAQLQGNATSNA